MTTSHENLGSFTICPSCGKGLIIKAAGPGGAVKKEPLEVSDCCGATITLGHTWATGRVEKCYFCTQCHNPCDMRTGLRVTNEDNYTA